MRTILYLVEEPGRREQLVQIDEDVLINSRWLPTGHYQVEVKGCPTTFDFVGEWYDGQVRSIYYCFTFNLLHIPGFSSPKEAIFCPKYHSPTESLFAQGSSREVTLELTSGSSPQSASGREPPRGRWFPPAHCRVFSLSVRRREAVCSY